MGGFRRFQRPFQVLIIGAILAGAGVYGYGQSNNTTTTTTTTPAVGTANLWISSSGTSTCTRQASADNYTNSLAGNHVCDTFNRAYQAATDSGTDTVLVRCGSYGGQTFAVDAGKTTGTTTFQSETPHCATIQGVGAISVNTASADYITIKDFTIISAAPPSAGGYTGVYDGGSVSNASTNVVIDGNDINYGELLGGTASVYLKTAQNWTISNNRIGPSCCGADAPSSPEGIRVGSPGNAGAACVVYACNITISDNFFQFIMDDDQYWPVSGFGAAPETKCLNATLCHLDSIHFFGCANCSILRNKIYAGTCTGIFVENGANGVNGPLDIIGNAVTTTHCNGGLGINIGGASWVGPFNIKFNSWPSGMNICFPTSTAVTLTINIIGNYGVPNVNCGTASACSPGSANPNVTLNFKYNVWTNSTACDPTDISGATSNWVSTVAAPAVGQDMHITGGPAVGFVPASVTGGCPATDIDGDTPGSPCNAGADQ